MESRARPTWIRQMAAQMTPFSPLSLGLSRNA
jgi:hypothetical protein